MKMFGKMRAAFQRFMYGRYGSDKLNMMLLAVAVVLLLVSNFDGLYWLGIVAYVPLLLSIYRMYSRNIYKRRQENLRFLSLVSKVKTRVTDRDHRYFKCPKCKQTVRVPKGVGKIAITCPKCREKFTKKA